MSGRGLNGLEAGAICRMKLRGRAHVIRAALRKLLLFRCLTNLA